jgi:6-pyruvoyltetrahydropterin/6-carboxytetrahydropterin synthase
MTYQSTKRYGHDIGLSCCFRQWRAASHCRFLHGYALAVRLTFEADELDWTNWVMDFGALKPIKEMLVSFFDHKLIVAEDDPFVEVLTMLDTTGLAEVVILPATGCEGFAKVIHDEVSRWLEFAGHSPRVRLVEVEVAEHGANSGIYRP